METILGSVATKNISTPSLSWALVHNRVTPNIKFTITHTWVEKGTARVKCLLALWHNTFPGQDSNPSSALALGCTKISAKKISGEKGDQGQVRGEKEINKLILSGIYLTVIPPSTCTFISNLVPLSPLPRSLYSLHEEKSDLYRNTSYICNTGYKTHFLSHFCSHVHLYCRVIQTCIE